MSSLMMVLFGIFMVLLLFNVGMYWMGRTVAQGAAADGLAAAQSFGQSEDEGRNAAHETLAGFGLLRTVSPVEVSRGDSVVTVTVRVEVQPFVFPSFGTIEVIAEGPAERYYTPSERN